MQSDITWSNASSARDLQSPLSAMPRSRLAESILAGLSIPLWILDLDELRKIFCARTGQPGGDPVLHSAAIVSVNLAALRYHKASCEHTLLKSLQQVFLPATIAAIANVLTKVRAGGSIDLDIDLGRLDGSSVHTRARFDLIATDRREDALAMIIIPRSPGSNLVKAIPDLLFELDPNGVYVDFAGPPEDALVAPREFLGKSVTETMPPEVAHRTLAALQRLKERGGSERFEYALTTSDGVHWYEARMTALPSGGATAYVRDITEQKSSDWRLQENEKRFRTLADGAPVMLWMTDRYDGCTYYNKAALEFSGQAFIKESGAGWMAGIHPDDTQRCLELIEQFSLSPGPFRAEFRMRRHDGRYRWLLAQGVPRFSEGEFIGYFGSTVDVTEIKEKKMEN